MTTDVSVGLQAEEGPEGALGGPSSLVHQSSHHPGQTLYQVCSTKLPVHPGNRSNNTVQVNCKFVSVTDQ